MFSSNSHLFRPQGSERAEYKGLVLVATICLVLFQFTCILFFISSVVFPLKLILLHASLRCRNTKSKVIQTRSSWLNCALRADEAVYWVSIGQLWLVFGGTESVWGGTSWSVEGIYAFIYWKSGDLVRWWHQCLTHSLPNFDFERKSRSGA